MKRMASPAASRPWISIISPTFGPTALATVTNLAYRPGTAKLVMTESETGTILEADLPALGAALYSHA